MQIKEWNNEPRSGVHRIGFQKFFVWAFKIVVDSWKFNMLLLYILWDDRPIFMISASNKQLQQQLEYTLLKRDCHSWWISKMQSDTLEERYAIKVCFKLGKKPTGTYGMLHTESRKRFRRKLPALFKSGPSGQYTDSQLHPCHRLFDQYGHQDSSSPSLYSRPCSLSLLVIP